MRIGINARTFSVDEPDGAVQAARKLTYCLGNRKDVDLVLYGDSQLSTEFPNANRVCSTGFFSNSPFFGVIWERVVLPSLVDAEEIDVLLCPNGNAPPTRVGCPIVTYVHDVNAQKGMSSGVHRLYRRLIVPFGIKRSDAVITVSEFSKAEISEYLPVENESIHVVYNGIDEFYLTDDCSEYMNLPDKYLLYVGAMNPRKNVQRLIEAYSEIRDHIPHELVLIGPQNKSVYKKLDLDGMSEDIITPGFLPKAQLKYAYENADGFIYPSLYEGFGIPPLEAMACGTPVVASNRSSLPEILNGWGNLVDPTDISAISKAMMNVATSDTQLKDKKGMKNHAQRFTWEQASEDLLGILESVIDR